MSTQTTSKHTHWFDLDAVLLILGIAIAAYPFLFPANQCPEGYTQQQIDASSCIIGADIGGGLIALGGIAVILVAVALAVFLLVWYKPWRRGAAHR